MEMSDLDPPSPRSSKATPVPKRRANSCVPCRVSKSRCSGGYPCSTCARKRQKPRCYYRNSFIKERVEDAQPRQSIFYDPTAAGALKTNATHEVAAEIKQPSDSGRRSPVVGPHKEFYGIYGLLRLVDEFKVLSPAEGQLKNAIESIEAGRVFKAEDDDAEFPPPTNFEVPVASASGTSDQVIDPLDRLSVKRAAVGQLLDEGRIVQAWKVFSDLVCDAELLGLDRDTNVKPDKKASESRRQIWWLLVELDVQLSLLVGRPPCISSLHGVPRPAITAASKEENNLRRSVLDFSQHALEVLNHSFLLNNDDGAPTEEKRTWLEASVTSLQKLRDELPPLLLEGLTDTALWISIARHHLEIQMFLMVLHCQILKSIQAAASAAEITDIQHRVLVRNAYEELLDCVRAVLAVFDYLHELDPFKSTCCWPLCFGVYCAAVILGIARLRQEVDVDTDSKRIERTLKIFFDLSADPRGPDLAHLAVDSLTALLTGINLLEGQDGRGGDASIAPLGRPLRSKSLKGRPGKNKPLASKPAVEKTMASQPSVSNAPSSSPTTSSSDEEKQSTVTPVMPTPVVGTDNISPKRTRSPLVEGDVRAAKRPKYEPPPPMSYEGPMSSSAWPARPDNQYQANLPAFGEVSGPGPSFQDPSSLHHSFEAQSFAPSASTSFTGNDQMEYSNLGFGSAHPDDDEYHAARWWVHPPMMYHPPMYDDGWQSQYAQYDMMTADVGSQGFYNPATMDGTMHDGQHVGLANIARPSPTRVDGMMIGDQPLEHPPLVHAAASAHEPGQDNPQFYPPRAETYARMDQQQQQQQQAMSSPNESPLHRDAVFPRPGESSSRRRSVADFRHQQINTWAAAERTPDYTQPQSRDKAGNPAQGKMGSPSHKAMLSPIRESQSASRRETANDRAAAARNPDSYPASRRPSAAEVENPFFPPRAPHPESLADQTRNPDGMHPHMHPHVHPAQWANSRQVTGQPYGPTGAGPYDIDMTNHAMAYDQARGIYSNMPAAQVVTTGPSTGDGRGQWWGR